LDGNKNVLRWGSEEIAIPYKSPKDNKIHRYFPDFIAEVRNQNNEVETLVIEVKPMKQTEPPKGKKKTKSFLQESLTFQINKAKWESAKRICQQKGWRFVILTENQIFPDKKDDIN